MGHDAPPRLSVLRLGHRRDRDKRITSHLGLTARAFGADEVVLAGDRDPSALETWDSVTERFGGNFESRFEESPLSWLRRISKSGEATIVHLTMYGEAWREATPSIPTDKPAVVVVGGYKGSFRGIPFVGLQHLRGKPTPLRSSRSSRILGLVAGSPRFKIDVRRIPDQSAPVR